MENVVNMERTMKSVVLDGATLNPGAFCRERCHQPAPSVDAGERGYGERSTPDDDEDIGISD